MSPEASGISKHPVQHSRTCLFFILVMFVVGVRKWESLAYPRLHAEDGPVFISGAFSKGFLSLFDAYAGYLHLTPRIGSLVAAQMPVPLIPAAGVLFSFAVTGLAYATILWRPTLIRNPALMLAVITLLPNTGEVFFSPTNTIWFAGLILFLILIGKEPETRLRRYADYLVLAVCSLSGVYSIFLAPFFVVRAVLDPKARYGIFSAAIVVGGAITQAICLKLTSTPSSESGAPSFLGWLPVLAKRSVAKTFLQSRWFRNDPDALMVVAVVFSILLCGVVWFGWRNRDRVILCGVGVWVLLLAGTALRLKIPDVLGETSADRYFFLPGIIAILVTGQLASTTKSLPLRAIAGMLLAMSALNGIQRFWMERYPIRDWTEGSSCFGGEKPCSIEIVPDGWALSYDPTWPRIRSWQKSGLRESPSSFTKQPGTDSLEHSNPR